MSDALNIFYSIAWEDQCSLEDRIYVSVTRWRTAATFGNTANGMYIDVFLDTISIIQFSPGDTVYVKDTNITYEMYCYICKRFADIFTQSIETIRREYLIFE